MTGLNRVVWHGMALAATLMIPVSAHAQAAGSFDELQRIVKIGDTVVIHGETGRETKGTLTDVSGASLVVGGVSFDEAAVRRITRKDSVLNGVLLGLGGGAVGAWAFTRGNCGPAGDDPECSAIAGAVGVLAFVPSGLVVGWLIDRAINKTVFQSSVPGVQTSLAMSPIVTASARGVGMSVRF
jgi:hypothetical protein